MVKVGKLINKPRIDLSSYFVEDTESVDGSVGFQKNPTRNHTDSLLSLNIYVEPPKIRNTKYSSSVKDSSQDLLSQTAAMKYMN